MQVERMDQQAGVPAHRPDRAVMAAVSIMVAGIGGFLALVMVFPAGLAGAAARGARRRA